MVFLIVFIIIILNNILFFDTIYDKSRDLAIAQLKLNRYTLSTEDGEQQATQHHDNRYSLNIKDI